MSVNTAQLRELPGFFAKRFPIQFLKDGNRMHAALMLKAFRA